MTAIQVQAPPLGLDPATRRTLLQTIVDTTPYLPNSSEAERAAQRDAAFALVAALNPRDPVQAMLVAQLVAANHACLHAYRCAALPNVPPALQLRYQDKALALSRLVATRMRDLRRLQDAGLKAAASAAGPRAAQAPATASGAQVRTAAPAARPWFATAGQRRGGAAPAKAATGTEAGPGDAAIDQMLAEVTGCLAAAGIANAA